MLRLWKLVPFYSALCFHLVAMPSHGPVVLLRVVREGALGSGGESGSEPEDAGDGQPAGSANHFWVGPL